MNFNDISDLSSSNVNRGGALGLTVRKEKVVLTTVNGDTQADPDFHVTAALEAMNGYVMVRLPGRGGADANVFDPTSAAVYSFLINPEEVQIQRQTIDQQSFSRSGWQVGVWGEDFVQVTLHGKSAGRYFSDGTTDFYAPYTESYRNLAALELVFENNGYWFEGEQLFSSLQQYTSRIKMHQDVELTVGEFIWNGMFETFEVIEDADTPFLVDFTLSFTAWKERYRRNTPYPDPIGGDVQRGHVPIQIQAPASSTSTPATPTIADNNITSFITDPESGGWNNA